MVDDISPEESSAPASSGGGTETAAVSESASTTQDSAASPKAGAAWRETISDDKVRRFAERFNSPAEMAEAALGLRQKLSKTVTVPGKRANATERAAFNKALGVPADHTGYEAAYPESLPAHLKPAEGQGNENLDGFLKLAHSAGFTQKQVDATLGWYFEQAQTVDAATRGSLEEATEKANADLTREWGGEYKANAELAMRAAEVFGGDDLMEMVDRAEIDGVKLGNHPQFVKAFAAVGRAMREAEPLIGAAGGGANDLERRHADLTRRLNDAIDRGDSALVQRLDNERNRVSARLVGTDPIVGADGRSY